MDRVTAMHLAARRYLLDRWAYWVPTYAEVPNTGRASDGYHYTDEAKNVFPRYNVLAAIRVDVERLDPDHLPSADELVERLLRAAADSQNVFTEGSNDPTQLAAMGAERDLFATFVREMGNEDVLDPVPLPYRRTLDDHEAASWQGRIEASWHLETGGWWDPVIPGRDSGNAIAVRESAFWSEGGGDGPATLAARMALRALGIDRVIVIREYGPSFEVAVDGLEPTYDGAEGLFTSEPVDWLVFASHEGVTMLGGTIVEPFIRLWPAWEQTRWAGWDE